MEISVGLFSLQYIVLTRNSGLMGAQGGLNDALLPMPVMRRQNCTKGSRGITARRPHLAPVTVEAEVCLRCGERLYSRETALRLEQVRQRLVENKVEPFKPLGVSFQIPA